MAKHTLKQAVYYVLTVFLILFTLELHGQSSWTQLDSPGGGMINNLFKVNDSIFIAGGQNGCLYTSRDSGKRWKMTFYGNPGDYANNGVRAIIWNSENSIIASTYSKGIIISSDSGSTWSRVYFMGGERMVNTDAGILFANDNKYSSLYYSKSLDSGKTWSNVPTPWVPSLNIAYSMTSKGNNIYVGFIDHIKFTTDFGVSWQTLGNIFPASGINSLTFLSDSVILAGTNNGFYISSDSGDSWVSKNNGLPNASRIKVSLINDTLYATGNTGLSYSTNLGNDWIHYNNYHYQSNIYSLIKVKDLILAATDFGVFRIIEQGWENSSIGIYNFNTSLIKWATLIFNDNMLLYNSDTGVFYSKDFGNNWSNVKHEDLLGGVSAVALKDSLGIAHSKSCYFYKSTDGGINWEQTGYFDVSSSLHFAHSNSNVYASVIRNNYPYSPTYGLYLSANFGLSWLRRIDVFPYSSFGEINIIRGDTIYSEIYDLLHHTQEGIYKSDNKGASWIAVNNGLNDKSLSTVSTDNNYDLYCSNSEGIWKLNKPDNVWNLVNSLRYTALIKFNNLNHMLILRGGKIFASADHINWFYISAEINSPILTFELDSLNYCYAVIETGEVFKSNYPITITNISDDTRSELSFSLHQNYPNPFNPKTTIQYSVGSTQHVQLKIFDILGNEAAVIVNEERTPGSYSVEFDASRFASGVYIYRLIAGENVLSRKMIVLK